MNLNIITYRLGKWRLIGKLDSEVVVITAQDANKDAETKTSSISIPDNIGQPDHTDNTW